MQFPECDARRLPTHTWETHLMMFRVSPVPSAYPRRRGRGAHIPPACSSAYPRTRGRHATLIQVPTSATRLPTLAWEMPVRSLLRWCQQAAYPRTRGGHFCSRKYLVREVRLPTRAWVTPAGKPCKWPAYPRTHGRYSPWRASSPEANRLPTLVRGTAAHLAQHINNLSRSPVCIGKFFAAAETPQRHAPLTHVSVGYARWKLQCCECRVYPRTHGI